MAHEKHPNFSHTAGTFHVPGATKTDGSTVSHPHGEFEPRPGRSLTAEEKRLLRREFRDGPLARNLKAVTASARHTALHEHDGTPEEVVHSVAEQQALLLNGTWISRDPIPPEEEEVSGRFFRARGWAWPIPAWATPEWARRAAEAAKKGKEPPPGGGYHPAVVPEGFVRVARTNVIHDPPLHVEASDIEELWEDA